MKAVITIGISGSGKSTTARREYPHAEIIERDAIRRAILTEQGKIDDATNIWSVWKFNRENEDEVTRLYNIRLAACAAAKRDIVCADTNLNPKYRAKLEVELEELGYEVELRFFPIDYIEACRRDEQRRDTVGREFIYKQYLQYMEASGRKKYVADVNKPRCVLVDLDGTLAHMNGKRGPFDWDKVDVDDVDEQVRFLLHMLNKQSGSMFTNIIIFSGRDGSCKAQTRRWLAENEIPYDAMFMRAAGDMRKDSIVKEEMFWEHIADTYNCVFVIDDRPQMIRLWHELGVKCFAVGNQYIEF